MSCTIWNAKLPPRRRNYGSAGRHLSFRTSAELVDLQGWMNELYPINSAMEPSPVRPTHETVPAPPVHTAAPVGSNFSGQGAEGRKVFEDSSQGETWRPKWHPSHEHSLPSEPLPFAACYTCSAKYPPHDTKTVSVTYGVRSSCDHHNAYAFRSPGLTGEQHLPPSLSRLPTPRKPGREMDSRYASGGFLPPVQPHRYDYPPTSSARFPEPSHHYPYTHLGEHLQDYQHGRGPIPAPYQAAAGPSKMKEPNDTQPRLDNRRHW